MSPKAIDEMSFFELVSMSAAIYRHDNKVAPDVDDDIREAAMRRFSEIVANDPSVKLN